MTSHQLFLYNTATRDKVPFEPIVKDTVKMYCCGPTVYNYAHIGNLRTYIFEDFLRRTLEYLGYEVNHVVNITDVGHLTSDADTGEDKLEKGAKREGASVWDIAKRYTEAFQNDWKKLNLKEPSLWPRATDHIGDQIELIQHLEEKGYTYQIDDGLYFDTEKFPKYADFAKLDIDNLEAGKRVAMAEGKKNSTDFALWKLSPTDVKRAMEWDSPWGKGFPGWHVECSAMAIKHLGETLDIHCGGTDHIRVHHSNEIAQSEAATGKPFANFWIHGGWLLETNDEGQSGKMSKSNEEFVRLKVLEDKGYHPLDYRYFCMTSHYRNYLNFNWTSLNSAQAGLKKLKAKVSSLVAQATKAESEAALQWKDRFFSAVYDDLNIPQALGVLNQMLKDSDLLNCEKGALILEFDNILGLNFASLEKEEHQTGSTLDDELYNLLREREDARKNKDWQRADEIRDIFTKKGYSLKDGPEGTQLIPL